MLVRLVQLLYLQTKLSASKDDKNNSEGNEEPPKLMLDQLPVTQSTLLDQLQQHRQRTRYTPQQRYMTPHGTAQTNIRPLRVTPYSSDQGTRVYRMGSSVTQVYSKNYPSGHADVQSANGWANDTKSRTVYFDNALPETKPWSSNRTQTTASFKPNYGQQHHYDNRNLRISSYPATPRYGYTQL